MRSLRLVLPVSVLSLVATTTAMAAVIPGQVVVRVGDVPIGAEGSAVESLQSPFVESDGTLAFSGRLTGAEGFIFRNDQVIFRNSEVMGLTVGDVGIGTATNDLFVFSPQSNGQDALYTNNGLFAVAGMPAPGVMGANASSFIEPSMVDGGVMYWIMGLSTGGRALVTSPDGTVMSTTLVLRAGDMIDGNNVIDDVAAGISHYMVSYNNMHRINSLRINGGEFVIAVNDSLVARAGQPAGNGGSWQNFDIVAVTNAGNYAFSGDTSLDGATDEFVAYNGTIVAQEGDTIAGVTLTGPDNTVRMLALDEGGNLIHTWGPSDSAETVFYSCGLGLSPVNTSVLIATNDELDLDGDGVGDGLVVSDFRATSATNIQRGFASDGVVYLEVLLAEGMTSSEAIVQIPAPSCCGNTVVESGETCDDGNLVNTDACVACADAVCGDGFTLAGIETCDDAGESATCDDDCSAPSCGDGNTNEAAGEECDDAGESATCNANCTAALCGDGIINMSAGETCDDSGESATCDDDCSAVECGDLNTNEAAGEQCDEGAVDTMACDANCSTAVCGDSYINAMAGETCDDGMKSATCDANCTSATCGDGYVNAVANEQCDGDGFGMGGQTATCDLDCTDAVCGDGNINDDADEDCDDGNKDDTDDCVSGCLAASCGDTFIQAGVEECDDGNVMDGDGCSSTCLEEGEETTTGEPTTGEPTTGETTDTPTTGDTDTTGDPTTGDTENPTTGDTDSTTTDEPTSTSASGSATSPTGSSTATTATTAGTDTDTDTDTGGGVSADGCGCTTDGPSRPLPVALLGLLFLGLTRRRNRAA